VTKPLKPQYNNYECLEFTSVEGALTLSDMDQDELKEQFRAKGPLFEQLREEALYALESALQQASIKFHSLPSRIKKFDSFLKKVSSRETRRSKDTHSDDWDPFEEIRDIVGLRVVGLYLSDLDRIAVVIRNTFQVLSEDNKIEGAEVSSFGYMSVHFICMMKTEYSGPRYDRIAGIPFEIQVRTIAMDAWANISHHLDYKNDADVPADLRKDFYALSGLFYVADRHFEMFYSQSKQSQEDMKELFEGAAPPDEKTTQSLNLDSLRAYLAAKFPERERSNSNDISELLNSLLRSGFTTIGPIDEILDKGAPAFQRYELEKPPGPFNGKRKRAVRFNEVGVVRITMNIMNKSFLLEDRRPKTPDEVQLQQDVQKEWARNEEYRKLTE
jgi:GTP pyrophosphokinase